MNKILVLEDYVELNDKLCELIKGIQEVRKVVSCTTIKEAKKNLEQHKYSLIIVDLELPDGNGRDFIKYVRSIPEYRNTLIVIITGQNEPMDKIIDSFNGDICQRYFQKPIIMDDFKLKVSELINMRIVDASMQRLTIKRKRINVFIEYDDILYIETNNKVTTVYTIRGAIEIGRYSLNKLLEQLPEGFTRCHRSFVVNSRQVQNLIKTSNMTYLDMNNKTRIPVGISYKDIIEVFH